MIGPLRTWAESYRERGKYTPVGVIFHWVMAALVLYQLYSGWTMQRYLVGADKLDAYKLHSEIGLALLLLGVLRLVWRLVVPGPINDADRLGWRTTAAHVTHAIFYALFVILPLTGWILWSSIQPARPLHLAGLIPIPGMPFQDLSPEWQYWLLDHAENWHVAGVIVLTLLVPAHAFAALKHHFWDQHDVLEGMMPEVPDTHRHPEGPRYSQPEVPVPPRKGEG
ncbi:cytochrome b [Novosphingobium endophyticum]|uniref:Cytochrome b n=1 Tax=Novosphingobium endophyticum TaxID=1955250 RepID=A0A916X616_9SPHN|nr:cytochrome b/b6 domain-containing protein [Novosphingobium endophyticum]GGC02306.1 cytochrome b [Novosphingobium endophyticum]